MSVTDACNLGPDNWAERSTHVVQDMPIYAAVASSSRGPTTEWMQKCRNPLMLLSTMLSPMLVLYAIAEQCLPLWGNNISQRGRCLLFSQLIRHQRARPRIFFRIFKTLVYLHKVMLSTCFHAMTVSVLSLAKRIIVTRFKKSLRLHHISLMATSTIYFI